MINKRLHLILCIMFSAFVTNTYAQIKVPENNVDQMRSQSHILIKGRPYEIYDINYIQDKDWTTLYRIPSHPAFDSLLTSEIEHEILKEINLRRKELKSDTLLTSDFFYVWKPYFDWLHNEDPHYRIIPALSAPENIKEEVAANINEKQKRLPFSTYTINDSVIVRQSFDPQFKLGDLVLSINNTPMSEYLKYCYNDRYSSINLYLIYYYFGFAVSEFKVQLLRDGRELIVETEGMTNDEIFDYTRDEEYNIKIYEDAKCGYIQMKAFYPNNSRVIRIVSSAIRKFKKKGIVDVIIDVRRNAGGNGHSFDKLLSIFIDKQSIKYMKGQKLKVSEETLVDYDFLTRDMIGKNISIPDEYLINNIELDPKQYVAGMNYYVMISENTGSIAASFVNILQYNSVATIIGEPLLRNALKYGEVISGNPISYTVLIETGISTTEFDEYTKAVNGILMPDIHIPYVANEYMKGEDDVLNRLLEIIKLKK